MVRWNKDKKADDYFDEITWKDIKKDLIDNWAEKPEKWCDYCNNAKSTIPDGCLLKHSKKDFVKIVKETIENNNLNNFTNDELIKNMNIAHLSNGTLQNNALVVLSCLGFIKKDIIEYENKKKEKRFKYVFKKLDAPKLPSCIIVNEKYGYRHNQNIPWRETKYFGVHSKHD